MVRVALLERDVQEDDPGSSGRSTCSQNLLTSSALAGPEGMAAIAGAARAARDALPRSRRVTPAGGSSEDAAATTRAREEDLPRVADLCATATRAPSNADLRVAAARAGAATPAAVARGVLTIAAIVSSEVDRRACVGRGDGSARPRRRSRKEPYRKDTSTASRRLRNVSMALNDPSSRLTTLRVRGKTYRTQLYSTTKISFFSSRAEKSER